MDWRIVIVTWMATLINPSFAIDGSETTVLWTEKYLLGEVRIMGVAGDPDVWLRSPETVRPKAQASPSENWAKFQSYRVGLGYRYKSQDLYFSDRGFKEIFKLHLQNIGHDSSYSYNVTLESVFSGTSQNVYGIAVDWLAGTLYWTDSVYNWISVASLDKPNIYRHLIDTEMDKPMGIAVHPRKGYLFWSDYGAKPRIERARLDGSERTTIFSSKLEQPLGMSIDNVAERLYWVDDIKDTIEWVGFNGENHGEFTVPHKVGANPYHTLFSCAVYNNYIFVTDQFSLSIRAFDLSDNLRHVKDIPILALPYDIMVFNKDLQPDGTTVCGTGLKCEHLCLSLGDGEGRCTCKQGYTLQQDGISCKADTYQKPLYLYTIGQQLCRTRVNFVDRQSVTAAADVNCFMENLNHVLAIAFHVYAEWLYYSDAEDRTIYRMDMSYPDAKPQPIVANTGRVFGLAVDYINNNLYWSDADLNHIMVSRLDGSHAYPLLINIDNPRGIELDPFARRLYWAAPGSIWSCDLDANNVARFANGDVRDPGGMVLDIKKKTLYWADAGTKTISLQKTDGSDGVKKLISASEHSRNFRDITVFQDYIAWTDGENGVFFGRTDKADKGILRGYTHPDMNVSHDIITYGEYLQPLYDGHGVCDAIDNGGCDQLCLPSTKWDKGQCVCSVGFNWDKSKKKCTSNLVDKNFVMFVDPFANTAYQLDLAVSKPQIQGLHMETAAHPTFIDYDEKSNSLYWYDELAKVIRTVDMSNGHERGVTNNVIQHDERLTGMRIHGKSQRLFFTTDTNGFYSVELGADLVYAKLFYQSRDHVYPDTLNIYPQQQALFWLEKDQSVTFLTRMGMDGRQPMIHILNIPHVEDIRGMELDYHDLHLYIWNNSTVYRCRLDGSDWQKVLEWDGTLLSLAVLGDMMFFSDYNQKALYNKLLGTSRPPVTMTDPAFSRIQHVISYSPYYAPEPPTNPYNPKPTKPTKPNVKPTKHPVNVISPDTNIDGKAGASNSGAGGSQLPIIVGAAAGGVLLLAVILAVAIVCVRRRRKDKVPDVAYTTEAHDNPTYMKHSEVQRDPSLAATVPITDIAGGQQAEPLPDKKVVFTVPESGPDPYADIVAPAVGGLAPPDNHYEVPEKLDVQHLVEAEEVRVCVDETSGAAIFKSDN